MYTPASLILVGVANGNFEKPIEVARMALSIKRIGTTFLKGFS
jgi:hypothetical protein